MADDSIAYDPAADGYRLALDPWCLYGWGLPDRRGCYHRFGHFCARPLGHGGRCHDGSPTPRLSCETAQRPGDWDDRLREESNR